ncbi:hypothetical protein [Photobacterium nomapromontoriensis]|uniref:hypothetical protein n=1 Tax=Photobacterium nomapromontoriensis TaxID=2910237 RepID=UPI003D0B9D05
MRQRVGVEHLKAPLTNQHIESALAHAENAINALAQLPSTWLTFSNEKLLQASECLGFLLRQRVQLHKRGYPSRELEYLKLIERQIGELKQVYLSFYRLAPGLIHKHKSEEPEIYAWLMLQKELGSEIDNLLCGLATLDELEPATAMVIAAQSPVDNLDNFLAELIDGQTKFSVLYFEYLRIRQTLSVALVKRWLRAGVIKPQLAFPTLALQGVEEGIEWINDNGQGDQYLFERLITKRDRGMWFRQYFGVEMDDVSSTQAITFAKLLELNEFMVFDIESPLAPIDFMLTGDWKVVPEILLHLEHLDEHDGDMWLKALYVVYGSLLPVSPQDLGVEFEWGEAVDLLKDWVKQDKHVQNLPSRLGYALSFESTLIAMQDPNIDVLFRTWLWRQLCIHSHVYIPWDMAMPIHQQEWNFRNLKATPSVSERFNLRSHNAVVGH